MIKLSEVGQIPSLFNKSLNARQGYFTADGGALVPENGVFKYYSQNELPNESNAVRCVYDEWYWGTVDRLPESSRNLFTWGDKQM